MADDRLYQFLKQNVQEGLLAAGQGPEALRRQAAKVFAQNPPDFVKSATDQERHRAFLRVMQELEEPSPEQAAELEQAYRLILEASQQGRGGLQKLLGPNWAAQASELLELRAKGRPHFEYASGLGCPEEELPLHKLLNEK